MFWVIYPFVDKPIQHTWFRKYKRWLLTLGALAVIVPALAIFRPQSSLKVARQELQVGTVLKDTFEEFISVNATVKPMATITLVTLAGGQVAEKLVEEGALLKKGEPILRLSNLDYELEFMNRETALLDQLNNLRNTRMSLDKNLAGLRTEILEVEHQSAEAERNFQTDTTLFAKKTIARIEFERSTAQRGYLNRKKTLLRSYLIHDSLFRETQHQQLKFSSQLIEENLRMVKESMNNLVLRAPADGQLTSLNAEIGQTKTKGEMLGSLDLQKGFKLSAQLDELYLNRIKPGLMATCENNGQTYQLKVSKVYPQVTDGQFTIDLLFDKKAPENITTGQTLVSKISLGAPSVAILLPRGGFFQHTGGKWVFVLKENKAVRQDISLGRQNPYYYEVLSGLQPGDKVVTGNYQVYQDVQVLKIKD